MKKIIFTFLITSATVFAQENITAYYEYKTSFDEKKNDINLMGVKIIYELNQKGDEANFEIKKNDRFYEGNLYHYSNIKDKIEETQRNYQGKRAIVFDTIEKINWNFKDETKVLNNCNAKRADYEFEDGKLRHTVEVWYCPSKTRFYPISTDPQLFDIPGYVVHYKENFNNKVGMVREYTLLEFKENNAIQIKRPNEGERIDKNSIKKGFTTSN